MKIFRGHKCVKIEIAPNKLFYEFVYIENGAVKIALEENVVRPHIRKFR